MEGIFYTTILIILALTLSFGAAMDKRDCEINGMKSIIEFAWEGKCDD